MIFNDSLRCQKWKPLYKGSFQLVAKSPHAKGRGRKEWIILPRCSIYPRLWCLIHFGYPDTSTPQPLMAMNRWFQASIVKFLEDAIQNATSDRGATWSCFKNLLCVLKDRFVWCEQGIMDDSSTCIHTSYYFIILCRCWHLSIVFLTLSLSLSVFSSIISMYTYYYLCT